MYMMDVNKDLIFFIFCVLRPASIRDDEATTSKELILSNALADVPYMS